MAAPWEEYSNQGPWAEFQPAPSGQEVPKHVEQPQSMVPKAISDIPHEAYQTTMDTLGSIYHHLYKNPMDRIRSRYEEPSKGIVGDFSKGVSDTLSNVGDITKGLGSVAALPLVPAQGAARSLIGHPMADAITALNPEDQGMTYDQAKGNVDLALVGAAPRGVRATGPVRPPAPRREPPTSEEIRDASRQNYADIQNLGVEIRPQPVSQLARRIESDLTDLGLTQRNVPETYEILRTLQNPPPGAVIRGQDLNNIRSELTQARQNQTNRREAVAANAAINHIENYLGNIPQNHVLRGNVDAFRELSQSARGNWAAASRADTAAGKIELGELNAQTAHAGQNADNATRQAIKQLIRPDKNGRSMAQKMGFSAEEIAQMNRVARGTATGNLLRFFGKLAPTDLVKIAVHSAAAHQSAGSSVPLSAASYAAKRLGDRSTRLNAERLDRMVRERSPLHQQGANVPQPYLPAPSPLVGVLPAGGIPSPYLNRVLGTVPAGAEEDQP